MPLRWKVPFLKFCIQTQVLLEKVTNSKPTLAFSFEYILVKNTFQYDKRNQLFIRIGEATEEKVLVGELVVAQLACFGLTLP